MESAHSLAAFSSRREELLQWSSPESLPGWTWEGGGQECPLFITMSSLDMLVG